MTRITSLVATCIVLAMTACTDKQSQSSAAPSAPPTAPPAASPTPAPPVATSAPETTAPAQPPTAATTLTERQKIDLLIKALTESNATFIRNGKEYPGAEAASHLRTKLGYAGNRVKTARDFIDHLASKSSESGKPYLIKQPDGTTVESGPWLLERLAIIEGAAPAAAPAR